MRKIFLLLFLFFCNFIVSFAYEKPKIITREEWGANDSFMDKNGPEWTKKAADKAKQPVKELTEAQKQAQEKNRKKTREINEFLLNSYGSVNSISKTDKFYKGKELVWPIEYSSKIRGIVVHHTHSSYDDSFDGIRRIYRYHSLQNGRGDIGYNFLIGENGEIFEGRAGGEMAVGAHALRNNRQTIGISLIGNYDNKPISKAQYDSLEKLIKYLVEKYNIDLGTKQPFFKNCNKNCSNHLDVNYEYPLLGHRDVGHTTCPGDELYKQLDEIRNNLQGKTTTKTYANNTIVETKKTSFSLENKEKYFKVFDNIGEKKLLEITVKIEEILDKKYDSRIAELKNYILEYFKQKEKFTKNENTNKDIKVKLSYPEDRQTMTVFDGVEEYFLEIIDGKLFVDSVEVENFSVKNNLNPYVEITSWDRTPAWHKEGIYKDNKFRGEIFVYLKNGKFVVVNILPLEEYLKGLGEISNTENKEKAEAILISARTYALWYIEKDRKFKGEFYDGSDDPDVFQKYLGYDLERRSPNLNKILEETKGIVIKYNSEIIKPWYFSSSDGKTLSFYDYCMKNNNSKNFCETEKLKYPFLQSKTDPGGVGKKISSHGVGLSGTGSTYFSSRGWTSYMILKYFYEGIEL